MHLPGVGVAELADLEIDNYQAPQTPVEKDKVHSIPGISHAHPFLASYEAEVAAQFQEKRFQVENQGFFEIGFRIFVLQIKKFENKGILYLLFGRHKIFGDGAPATGESCGIVLRQSRSFVELRIDLTPQLAYRPTAS